MYARTAATIRPRHPDRLHPGPGSFGYRPNCVADAELQLSLNSAQPGRSATRSPRLFLMAHPLSGHLGGEWVDPNKARSNASEG